MKERDALKGASPAEAAGKDSLAPDDINKPARNENECPFLCVCVFFRLDKGTIRKLS